MGHSQGGLLTKMTAIDSGDTFWNLASNTKFADIDLDPEQRETIKKMAFIEPVPSVKRVIFLSTPHRGSYIAGSWLAHQMARLIVMPADVTRLGADLVNRNRAKLKGRFTGMGTSVIGMTPGQPFIEALSEMPIVPGVKANSIIAVTDPDVPRDQASDGVVEYSSAHIEPVESEFVVVSGHSCQDNPHTIQEVRRILLEHIKEFDRSQGKISPAAAPPSVVDKTDQGASGDELPTKAPDRPPLRRHRQSEDAAARRRRPADRPAGDLVRRSARLPLARTDGDPARRRRPVRARRGRDPVRRPSAATQGRCAGGDVPAVRRLVRDDPAVERS